MTTFALLKPARKIPLQNWMQDPRLIYMMQHIPESKIVGGAIRNFLINQKIMDIDIISPIHPKNLITLLKKTKIKTIPTGIQYGTLTLVFEGLSVEHTTLRQDFQSRNGRHPIVSYTKSFMEDAKRRDFTINALYANLKGEIFDPLKTGIRDLSPPTIRFIGNASSRIEEDYLRILRFFRFMAQYAPILSDKAGFKACTNAAGDLSKLSAERITSEFFKLLEAPHSPKILKKIIEYKILDAVLKDFTSIDLFQKAHKKITGVPLDNKKYAPIILLAALSAKTEPDLIHLSFSKDEKKFLSFCLTPPPLRSIEEALYLYGKDKTLALMLLGRLPFKTKIISNWSPPLFPINGKMLLTIGYEQGKALGMALAKTELWWLRQKFTPNKEACLTHLKTKLN